MSCFHAKSAGNGHAVLAVNQAEREDRVSQKPVLCGCADAARDVGGLGPARFVRSAKVGDAAKCLARLTHCSLETLRHSSSAPASPRYASTGHWTRPSPDWRGVHVRDGARASLVIWPCARPRSTAGGPFATQRIKNSKSHARRACSVLAACARGHPRAKPWSAITKPRGSRDEMKIARPQSGAEELS